MSEDLDDKFYERADEHINLSNDQAEKISNGKVSASMLYAAARYNAYVHATGAESAEDLAAKKAEAIEFFVQEYQAMLEENLDDYIENFERYMAAIN